jgi:Ala-tRNA(Pro) deacylase
MNQLTVEIVARLGTLNIEHRVMHHEAVTTSADAARVRGVSLGSGAKAMVVSSAGRLSLFVIPADKRLGWEEVQRALGVKSARLATPEELEEKTGLTKGSVPPFGNLIGLPTYIDHAVLEQPLIRFNAGSLTDSVEMPGKALLEATGGTPGYFTT